MEENNFSRFGIFGRSGLNKTTSISMAILIVMLIGIFMWRNHEATTKSGLETSDTVFAMDTVMNFTIYGANGEKALEAIRAEIGRLDSVLSTGNEASEVAVINRDGGGLLSSDTSILLDASLLANEITDGAFDITIYPVMETWGFTSGDMRVPADEELTELTKKVNSKEIVIKDSENAVFLPDGVKIDFGGIAKGYAGDEVTAILGGYEVTGAIANLGGNVVTYGTKPDGSLWNIGIRHPERENQFLGTLSLTNKSVITSGGYERFFEEAGTIYHHIIDPSTGYPAGSGIVSATIVSDNGMFGDALSTAVYVMGKERAISLWREKKIDFDMILFTDGGDLFITPGIESVFSSDIPYTVIE